MKKWMVLGAVVCGFLAISASSFAGKKKSFQEDSSFSDEGSDQETQEVSSHLRRQDAPPQKNVSSLLSVYEDDLGTMKDHDLNLLRGRLGKIRSLLMRAKKSSLWDDFFAFTQTLKEEGATAQNLLEISYYISGGRGVAGYKDRLSFVVRERKIGVGPFASSLNVFRTNPVTISGGFVAVYTHVSETQHAYSFEKPSVVNLMRVYTFLIHDKGLKSAGPRLRALVADTQWRTVFESVQTEEDLLFALHLKTP